MLIENAVDARVNVICNQGRVYGAGDACHSDCRVLGICHDACKHVNQAPDDPKNRSDPQDKRVTFVP